MGEAAGGALVGFVATIRHNSAEGAARRAHRTVVLPQWQGLGIGARLSDAVAELHRQQEVAYYGQTVHPRFGAYRDASPLWVPTKWNHTVSRFKIETWRQRRDNVRVRLRKPRFIYSHRYVGPRDACGNAYLEQRVTVALTSDSHT